MNSHQRRARRRYNARTPYTYGPTRFYDHVGESVLAPRDGFEREFNIIVRPSLENNWEGEIVVIREMPDGTRTETRRSAKGLKA